MSKRKQVVNKNYGHPANLSRSSRDQVEVSPSLNLLFDTAYTHVIQSPLWQPAGNQNNFKQDISGSYSNILAEILHPNFSILSMTGLHWSSNLTLTNSLQSSENSICGGSCHSRYLCGTHNNYSCWECEHVHTMTFSLLRLPQSKTISVWKAAKYTEWWVDVRGSTFFTLSPSQTSREKTKHKYRKSVMQKAETVCSLWNALFAVRS